MKKIELLAPAGNVESFLTAIYNGADAVYLGLQNFNARIRANNFTTENIKNIIETAHLYGVKVYITLNTLISNKEIDEFLNVVDILVDANADAFIVQDFGMANLLLKRYKNIVLHASTQMGIHNLDGALLLEKLGFKRVVLSRETKIEDIKKIKENTNLEIEFFVHGALCVCFSGNCYLSAVKNENSGNLGKCYQLCRLKYTVKSTQLTKKGYYLSPSDLCFIKNLKDLSDAGVDSFKIEGRLKRPSYVAGVVKTYRKAIDDKIASSDIDNLKKIFARGEFNERGYFDGNDNIINEKNQNHLGELIGKTVSVKQFKNLYEILIDTKHNIIKNDGLRFVDKNKEISLGVGNVEMKKGLIAIYSIKKPEVGSLVYRTLDFNYEQELISFKRYLPLDFYFYAKENEPVKLVIKYKNLTISTEGAIPIKAVNRPINEEDAKKSFSKLKDTEFALNKFYFESDNVFLNIKDLNELRREAIKLLRKAILDDYNKSLPVIEKNNFNFDKKFLDNNKNYFIINEQSNLPLIDEKTVVIFSPITYSKENIENLHSKLNGFGYNNKLYINLPIIATDDEVKYIDGILASLPFEFGVIAQNYWALKYLNTYPVIAGYNLNIYNEITANVLMGLGVEDFISSVESKEDFKEGIKLKNGKLPLMTFCHCPIKAVYKNDCKNCKYTNLEYVDEKGNEYYVRRYKIKNCYFELLSKETFNFYYGKKTLTDLRK